MKKELVSICNGKLIPLRLVNDSIFSQRLAGDGVGIVPYDHCIVSPCNGKVKLIMKGGHSMVIQQEDGLNIMVHIGINTVNLNGAGFTSKIKKDEVIKAGQEIVELDLDFMKDKKIDLTSVILVMDSKEVRNMKRLERGSAKAGQTVIIEYEME